MNIKADYLYTAGNLPVRHRINLGHGIRGSIDVTLQDIQPEDAPVAFKLTGCEEEVFIRQYNGMLLKPTKWSEMYAFAKGLYPVSELIKRIHMMNNHYAAGTKDEVEKEIINFADKFVIINNTVYNKVKNPETELMNICLAN